MPTIISGTNGVDNVAPNTVALGDLTFSAQQIMTFTAQTATGTSIDFTGIPSWAKEITVMFNGVSTNGASPVIVQLGSTTFVTTGYSGGNVVTNAGASNANYTSGFAVDVAGANTTAASVRHGHTVVTNISGNNWIESHSVGYSNITVYMAGGGSVSLTGTIDRIRITTINGTDTFDAGSINILVKG